MSSKITIIGAGSVGSTIAYTLSNEDIASEIVLIDINKKKVEGEVMDIAQGTCFRDPVSIIAGEYEDAKDSDIVIITSGIARKPGQTRTLPEGVLWIYFNTIIPFFVLFHKNSFQKLTVLSFIPQNSSFSAWFPGFCFLCSVSHI